MDFLKSFVSPEVFNLLSIITNIGLLSLGVLTLLGVVCLNLRYVLRYTYHRIRMSYLKGMVWNEVVYVGVVSEEELVGSIGLSDNMRDIMPGSTGRIFGFINWYRPMVSVLIRKDADDDQTYLYIGVASKFYKESSVQSWAQGANCSVERIDFEDIGFKPYAPFTATVDNYTPSRFTNSPTKSTIGNAISRIQGMQNRGEGGSLLVTYEPMIRTEQNLLERHIHSENSSENVYARIIDQVESFSGLSPSRGVMVGFSDSGDIGFSESILKVALDSIPNKGFDEDRRRYSDLHRRTGILSLPLTGVLGVLAYFSFTPLWMPIVALLFSVASISGISYLSSYWIEKASTSGAAPIPPFRRWSPRRYMSEWIYTRFSLQGRRRVREMSEQGRSHGYVAKPSIAEVLPFYQPSMMQLTSMPQNAGGSTNISKSVIPQVALSAGVNSGEGIQRFISSGDVVYEGISAKSNEPVYHTLPDINFGTAFGGDAGSGKTNALINHFVGTSWLSRKQTGYMGRTLKSTGTTPTINPIWFETKLDEIDNLVEMTSDFDPLVLKLHDPTVPSRLALEGGRLGDKGVTLRKIEENKNVLISSMQAVWGDSFGPQSKRVADSALMAAYLLEKDDLAFFDFDSRLKNPNRPNIIHLMYLLIGGDASLRVDKSLDEFIKNKKSIIFNKDLKNRYLLSHSQEDLEKMKTLLMSLDALKNLYDVPNALAPLQNKLPQLLKSEGLFETVTLNGESREEYDLDKLYTYFGPVIVDMTPRGSSLAPSDTMLFTMMVHYLLWQKIRMTASGWGGGLKFTPIYADEITNFTGRSEDNAPCASIIGEIKDQGRSYGVSHNVGYQNFSQMPKETKGTVLSFTSKIFFKFSNKSDQEEVIKQMSSALFTEANVRSFPQGVGIAQMTINGKVANEFIIKTPYAGKWVQALKLNEDVEMAFESIADEEVAIMRRERKRKIEPHTNEKQRGNKTRSQEVLEPDNLDDILLEEKHTTDRPQLSWGGDF